jgi:8-hydroxy-5-deazaflavin:NADPH oxidoreductase
VIGIIGGTGPEGLGLAARLAQIGEEVVIGSRDAERASDAASKVKERLGDARVSGADNVGASKAEIVFVTVPYAAQADTLTGLTEHLDGKIVVTAVVPMRFEKGRAIGVHLEEGSAAEQAQSILPNSRVVSAFQNLSAAHLIDTDHEVEADVIVCGNDKDARADIIALASRIPGVRGIDGGPASYSHYAEEITVLLVGINRRYKVESQVRITGIPETT